MEEAVLVAGPERGRVVEHPLARAVEVRVRRGQHPRDLVGDAGRLERLGVELDRDRRLGHRDEALAELDQVDVGVVGELRREHRAHALEERPARVGGELRVADLARVAGGAVGAGLEEAARVGDRAVADREPVQHREAVEPVVHRALAHLPLRRAGADQRAARARPEARPKAAASRPGPRSRATRSPRAGEAVEARRSACVVTSDAAAFISTSIVLFEPCEL